MTPMTHVASLKSWIRTPGLLLLVALGGLVGLGLAAQAVHWGQDIAALGTPWSRGLIALAVLGGLAALWLCVREVLAWLRVGRVERVRAALSDDDRPLETLEPVVLRWSRRVQAGRAARRCFEHQWTRAVCVNDRHAACEAVNALLERIDGEVDAAIRRESARCGVLVSLSGVGFIDAIVSICCALRVMRRTATAYGVRPGMVGTLRLARMVIAHAVVIDLAQHAADAVSTRVGVLAGAGAQGLASATLIVRLGLWTQHACRPVKAPRRTVAGFVANSAAQVMSHSVQRAVRRVGDRFRARSRAPRAAAM